MKVRNIIALALVVLSYVLLVPGLIKPLITLTASINILGNTTELFRETRSIVQTIRNLHESGNDFVAGLIFLFGIVVPVVKGVLLGVALAIRNAAWRYRLFTFVRSISKWAMSDVFTVAVYVAFMAAKATDNMDARIEPGFYWFAGYCLISLLALQVMKVDAPGMAGDGSRDA